MEHCLDLTAFVCIGVVEAVAGAEEKLPSPTDVVLLLAISVLLFRVSCLSINGEWKAKEE